MVDQPEVLLQRTLFCGPHPRVDRRMYVHAAEVLAEVSRDSLRLIRGGSASTNTYFGRFAASFWQRYTDLDSVRIEFDYACSDTARLRVRVLASDISGRERPLDTLELSGTGRAVIETPVRRFIDGGAIWFDVDAFDGDVTISDVQWLGTPKPIRPSSVVICTHNRPTDCISTVLALAGDPVAMTHIDAVYIVDQGTDRVDAQDDFPVLKEVLGAKLNYLTQPNLGGAGGFNRGIFELTRSGAAQTNIIVMDDDILCEPESVLRMSAFANRSVQPVLVGAQMLLLSETSRVLITAEWEALDQLKAGRPTAYAKAGADMIEVHQDARTDAGWNGWWSCLLPAESIDAESLSLPLFFQWDDIEFGIRARKRGFPTVTLPNSGVWHADFHLKDYDDWSRYFSFRNALIVAAVHTGFDGKHFANVVATEIGSHIVSMRYGLAATFLLAVRDFLDGPEILSDGGRSKLAQLKELRDRFPDTKIRPAAEVGAESDPNTRISKRGPSPKEDKTTQVLLKRAVKQYLGRVSPAPVSMSADDARWWHASLFSHVVVTDSSQTGVRIRQRDKGVGAAQARELMTLCRRIRKHAPEVSQAWIDAMPELTSRRNWQRLFDGE